MKTNQLTPPVTHTFIYPPIHLFNNYTIITQFTDNQLTQKQSRYQNIIR